MGLMSALLLVPLVAGPAWVGLAYPAAVRKAHARSVLRDGAAPWWAPVLGGALVRQIAAVPLALLAAASVGAVLIAQGWAGWAWIAAAAGLLWPMAALVARSTGPLKPYARLRPVLLHAPLAVAGLLTAAWVAGGNLPVVKTGSLAAAVAAQPRYEGSSALLAWGVDAMGLVSGTRAWALGWAEGHLGPLARLWTLGATFGQFWLVASVFAAGLLPRGEARRILRSSTADDAPPVGAARLAWASLLATVLTGALVSATAQAEVWATAQRQPLAMAESPVLFAPTEGRTRPELAFGADAPPPAYVPGLPHPTALRRIVETEQIGPMACRPGTLAGLDVIDRSLSDLLAQRRQAVEAGIDTGFDAVRARVPLFLDGYYSLTAEYLRTFHLVAGGAEDFLAKEMTRTLAVDQAFVPFRQAVATLDAPLPPDAVAARDRLLADCGFLPADDTAWVVTARTPEPPLIPAPDAEAIAFEVRIAAGGAGMVAGGIAGTVTGKLLAKVLAKEAFGLAAEAVGKVALGKVAGGLGGAATGAGAGALAGSVVPGLGTTVGAVVGGVLGGLAIGVAADYALLELEEAVSRPDFEAQILAAIDEAEAELRASLDPPQ
ncbi:hypothetical protein FHG66_05080 [Rubellimicrobium rubrum]|uniref:Uncharacterized protein n=2 Tax=Rubellimicrobium rubrum TaxID=2585369 RepID=A0A5C4MZ62_9RHOB|nr:hypothetical protein FHG66_05080 [Rubellimicrobium rubrum]